MTQHNDSTIAINHVSNVTELYCRYTGQTKRQPCFVELDCDEETLTARYNPEIGNAVPANVFHGRTIRWSIPCLSASAANVLLDELRADAEAILAGYSEEWDGNNNVGRLNESATAAEERIQDRCDRLDETDALRVCNACDWFTSDTDTADAFGITADTSDDELDAIVERAQADARNNGEIDLIDGCEKHFARIRDRLVAKRDE